MARSTAGSKVRALARAQHGVISRLQLLALGYSDDAIQHRIETGRLFVVYRGVYAVGRAELTREGKWMAAVLACGGATRAALSHESAAAHWQIARTPPQPIHVSSLNEGRSRNDIKRHERKELNATTHKGVPTTTPAQTLIDLSRSFTERRLDAAINEADKLDLIHPKQLLNAARKAGRAGVKLRKHLERQTFQATDSELEREFLRLIRGTEIPPPETQQRIGRFRVDFYWPELEFVVETDGSRFHRTPSQFEKDRRLEQEAAKRGLTLIRVTHAQIFYERAATLMLLEAVVTKQRGALAPRG